MFENTEFRRLDVDSIDPENYEDVDEEAPKNDSTGPNLPKIRELISENKSEEALLEVLNSPPYSLSSKEKETVVLLVCSLLHSIPTSTIQKLSLDQVDLLLKYVYKGMEVCSEHSVLHVLLEWQNTIFNEFGHGAIVRVITDRRRL